MTHEHGSNQEPIDVLQNWARDHADKSGGQLGMLDLVPELYPGQEGYSVLGDPQTAAVVDSIAHVAQPRYGEIAKLLYMQEESSQEVSRIGELLRAGNNVMLVTNHGDLIDIAISHAAFYSLLDRSGYHMKTGIIISKMVAFLAYRLGEDLAPALDILKILEDEQFLSYPRTESAKKRGIGRLVSDKLTLPNEVDRHNKHMRDRVQHRLGEGSLLLAVAASGTVDKPTAENPNVIAMANIGSGTAKLMQSERTFVVPVAVSYGGDKAVFQICDIPRSVRSDEQAHEVMEKIAETLSYEVADKTFVYQD